MIKALVGLVGTLFLVVMVGGMALREAKVAAEDADREAAELAQQLLKQKEVGEYMERRFDLLDASLADLGRLSAERSRDLKQTLAAMGEITQTEGDSDETMSCAALLVPRQLDRLLRAPAGDRD